MPVAHRSILRSSGRRSSGADASASRSQKPRALIIADIPAVRLLMSCLLGDRWVIDEACDDSEALQACATHRYDLVSIDVAMSGMGGIVAAREIRMRPGPPPRIIGVSAISPFSPTDDAGAFDAVLNKPISVLRLAELLDSIFGGRAVLFGLSDDAELTRAVA